MVIFGDELQKKNVQDSQISKIQFKQRKKAHQCTFVIKMTLQLFSDKFFCNCQKLQGLVCYNFIAEVGFSLLQNEIVLFGDELQKKNVQVSQISKKQFKQRKKAHQCTFVIKMTFQLFSDKFFCNFQKLQGLVCYSFIAEVGSPYYKMNLIHVVCYFFFFFWRGRVSTYEPQVSYSYVRQNSRSFI